MLTSCVFWLIDWRLLQCSYRFFISKFKDFSQTFQRPNSDFQRPVMLISSSKINLKYDICFSHKNVIRLSISFSFSKFLYYSFNRQYYTILTRSRWNLVGSCCLLKFSPFFTSKNSLLKRFDFFFRCQKVSIQEMSKFKNFQRPQLNYSFFKNFQGLV